ncbi:MAG: fused MFS/spermidine synthase [Rhodospirillales bacterium]|nr:fused MFS/spermidine synthase [Rhodospirillales bacterium]
MHRSTPTVFLHLLLTWMLLSVPSSFAAERLLIEKPAMFGSVYVTEDGDGLRTLRFARYGARQSVVKLGDPTHLELAYARVLPLAFAFVPEPKSALVIGLGGGTIPSFLRSTSSTMKIDAVDIDPVVVDIAKSHFGFREDAGLKAHVADGRAFVEAAEHRYDFVFLDGFGQDSVPKHLTTREFLIAVRNILAPGGIVLGNVWGRDVNRLYDAMVRTYRDVFREIYIVDVIGSGNKIVIATPNKFSGSHRELVRRAQQAGARLKLKNDLGDVAENQMRLPGIDGEKGEVLVDSAQANP